MLCLVGGILTPALLGGNDCNLRTPKLFHTEFKPKSGKDNLHTLYFNQQQRDTPQNGGFCDHTVCTNSGTICESVRRRVTTLRVRTVSSDAVCVCGFQGMF